MKKVLLVAALVSAVAASNALASSALTIFNTTPGTAVTYDSASGAYPVITAIMSQPGTVNGHSYTAWAILAQDSTGSIDLYGALPSGSPYVPTVGDAISVSGTYSPYHQIPEIASMTAISQMSVNNPLPSTNIFSLADILASQTIPQNMAGYLVEVTNVLLYSDSGATTPAAGNFPDGNLALYAKDDSGNIMEVYVWVTSYSTSAELIGTPIPVGRVNIVGLLSASPGFNPEMTPLKFIPLGPQIQFTNILSNLVRPGDDPTNTTFTEYALRPGETLTIDTRAFDINGSNVTIYPSTTAPGGSWSASPGTSGTNVQATFTFTPSSGNASNVYQVTLGAQTGDGSTTNTWSIYVPSAEEQNIVISEFLANPTTDTNSPNWNPLHRPYPGSTNAYADDEFIEIVNMSGTTHDFYQWTFYDSVALRHEFYNDVYINPSNTVVLYGGKLNNETAPPSIPGYSEAFSDTSAGVSVLNDSGDTIRLYNGDGHLVDRVVYTKATSAKGISWTRFPTVTNDFVEHTSVVCTNASPGLQPDQTPYTAGPTFYAPPTISHIADVATPQGTATSPIAFTVGDPLDPATSLTVSGESSNPTLVPNGNILFAGGGASRTVTITPAAGQSGVATITVDVGNTHLRCTTTNFVFAVTPTNNPPGIFCDDFNYPDGSIITNSSFVWDDHSGTVGQMQVTNGQLQVTYRNSEDVHTTIAGSPYAVGSGPLYFGFTVNFSELPNSLGSYFAHVNTNTSYFYARVWAATMNAAPGKFRLGIVNSANSADIVEFPQDLDTNITYKLVVKYDLLSGVSTLWVNPAWEGSASVSTTDGTSPAPVSEWAFREASGMGTIYVDDLCIGTSFTSVAPVSPIPLNVARNGSNAVLTWENPAFRLLSGPTAIQITNPVAGATSPYTNAISGSMQYFRLIWP